MQLQVAWAIADVNGVFKSCNDVFSALSGYTYLNMHSHIHKHTHAYTCTHALASYTEAELQDLTLFNLTINGEMHKNMEILAEMLTEDPVTTSGRYILHGMSKVSFPQK